MQSWILTAPRESVSKRALKIMLDKNDVKKWIIGKETGKNGYEHWQIRLESSNDHFFDWCKQHIPTTHIEKAERGVDESEYEAKDGQYIKSSDRVEVLKQRYGQCRPNQKRA